MPEAVGGPSQNPYAGQVGQTTEIKGRDITGAGLASPTGTIPNTPNDPSYGAVLESIARLMPQMTGEVLDVLMLEITVKMKELEESSQKDKIKCDQETKRAALTEKHDKLMEAEKKIKETMANPFLSFLKMIFQAIFAAIMTVLGGLLAAVPGFQAVGALMMTIGVLSLVMMIDSAVQKGTGMGIMGNIMKHIFGASDEVAQGFDMAAKITLAVLGLAASLAAFLVPGGQASAVANLIQSVSTIISAAGGVLMAATDVASGAVNYTAAKGQAEARKLQAEGKEMEAFIQQLDDFIDQALQRLTGASDRFNAMLDSQIESIQDAAKTVARAKFAV